MKAQVLYGINDLRYEEKFPNPMLKQGNVLVQVKACGICGSDVNRVLNTGAYFSPAILGHEFAGVVKDVYDMEDEYLIGKKVAVFPLIPCQQCVSCNLGNYQLCESYDYIGSRSNGAFSEFVSVPKWNLIEIPDDISFEVAAMLEPMAVAFHSLRLADNIFGKKIIITGTGTIASMLAQFTIAGGASHVIVIGRDKQKLGFVKTVAPDISIIDTAEKGFNECVNEYFGGKADIIIEATGASTMIAMAIQLVDRKGTVVLLGNPADDVKLQKEFFWQILRKEIIIKGSWNSSFGIIGKNDWEDVLILIKNKKIETNNLVTHRLPLSELMQGIQIMTDKNILSNKVMVVFDEK